MPDNLTGPEATTPPGMLAQAIRRLLARRTGGAQSSPSVFDAKTAIDERKRKLQEALEGKE